MQNENITTHNTSCPDFIEAVSPEYVIFSAGNTHKLTATNQTMEIIPKIRREYL